MCITAGFKSLPVEAHVRADCAVSACSSLPPSCKISCPHHTSSLWWHGINACSLDHQAMFLKCHVRSRCQDHGMAKISHAMGPKGYGNQPFQHESVHLPPLPSLPWLLASKIKASFPFLLALSSEQPDPTFSKIFCVFVISVFSVQRKTGFQWSLPSCMKNLNSLKTIWLQSLDLYTMQFEFPLPKSLDSSHNPGPRTANKSLINIIYKYLMNHYLINTYWVSKWGLCYENIWNLCPDES